MAVFPTAKDIYIEVEGRRLAAAQSYRVKTTRDARFVESFGSAQPAGTVAGQPRHTIELTRLQVVGEAGPDFQALSDFTIVIVKPDPQDPLYRLPVERCHRTGRQLRPGV